MKGHGSPQRIGGNKEKKASEASDVRQEVCVCGGGGGGEGRSQILAEESEASATVEWVTSEPQFSHLHDVPIGCPPSGSEKSRILRSRTLSSS